MNEFELIQHYWVQPFADIAADGVIQGPGSDCAVVRPDPNMDLVVSTDTCALDVHFRHPAHARNIGRYALATALSDLAAAGAQPLWFTLALTVPDVDLDWMDGASAGMAELAREHGMALIGGNMTRGPLSFTPTVYGQVPQGSALLRSGGLPGDAVYVSGTLGTAGLRWLQQEPEWIPPSRIALGIALREWASAAVDLSDGLLADLGHLTRASGCGARLDFERIPLADKVRNHPQRNHLGLSAGGDYELCFCVPQQHCGQIELLSQQQNIPLTRIGELVQPAGVNIDNLDGAIGDSEGYRHF